MRMYNQELIKKWEGLELEAYLPTPHDVWTIGWGHTKTARKGMVITQKKAQQLFNEDIAWAEAAVNRLVKVGLNQNQFDSLVSLVFNIGTPNFSKSTLLRKLNAGDYEGAAEEFPRWNKQRQNGKLVVLRGLVRRRAEEMEYFLSPVDVKPSANFLAENDTTGIVKPLMKSKEVLTGAGSVVTGVVGAVAALAPEVQQTAVVAVCVAAVAFGAFIVYNRVNARNKGER